MFMHNCLHLDYVITPGSRPIKSILWIKVLLDYRLQYESLEGLIDFVAFLVQKLWQNNQILIRKIPGNPPGVCKHFRVFGPNFGTRNARESITGSKDSYYSLESNKTLSP